MAEDNEIDPETDEDEDPAEEAFATRLAFIKSKIPIVCMYVCKVKNEPIETWNKYVPQSYPFILQAIKEQMGTVTIH